MAAHAINDEGFDMFVRRLAIAFSVLLASVWLLPAASAQAISGSSDVTAGTATVEKATPDTMESLEEKPAPKFPRPQPKAEPIEEDYSAGPDMSLLVPQDEVQQRRQAALVAERKAQEQVELAKPSVRRTKVVRLDNQPKQKTRPIAIIKGTLGPWGYGQRVLEGTAGPKSQKENQLNQGAGAQVGRPGQPGGAQGLAGIGSRRAGRDRGR